MRTLFLLALALTAVGASAQSGVSSNFAVTTAGDTLRVDIEYRSPLLAGPFLQVDGERRELGEFAILHLDGTTNAVVDGRKLAPLLSDGRLRFYARTVSSPGAMVPMGGPGGAMTRTPGSSSQVGYIQAPGGPVEKATFANLQRAMADNPESLRLLGRSRSLTTARWVTTVLGAAAFATGALLIVQAQDSGDDYTPYIPLVVAGSVGTAVGSYILPGMADTARDRAIDTYNQD